MENKNLSNIYKKKFETDGFVIIKNFLSKKKAKNIKNNLFFFLKKNYLKFKKKNIHLTKNSKKINSVHHLRWPFLKKFSKNKKIKFLVKDFFQENVRYFGAEVFAKPSKFGMSVPIHQDNFYWNLDNAKGVTVWIALDKSSKKNGGLFYFKKSHKLGLLEHKNSYVPGSSQELKNKKILNNFKKTTPPLNVGDALIHHCLVIHGSNSNRSNLPRTGLTLRFISSSSKINKKSKKIYEKKLKEQFN